MKCPDDPCEIPLSPHYGPDVFIRGRGFVTQLFCSSMIEEHILELMDEFSF
jgi:hypothetical protein